MPPPMRYDAGNNLASHYAYPNQTSHSAAGLPPPSLGSNPSFITPSSMNNPFGVNGNTLGMTGGFGTSGLGMAGATGLASHTAQMSFASASLPQSNHNGMSEVGGRGSLNKGRIREVWKGNLHEEMAMLRQLIDKYPYIAMDTEFPGLVARPMGAFRGKSDYHYQCLRCNVDLLKIIQLGITLFSEEGDSPPATSQPSESGAETGRRLGGLVQLPCTWQFNFKFSLKDDMYAEVSIEALRQAGVDFQSLERDGIEPFEFGALLISSGMVCDEDVRWISFHGGYDFGYLTKLLICKPLPDDEVEFDKLMKKFFPSVYDIKYLMKQAIKDAAMGRVALDSPAADVLAKFEQKSGLENLAELLKIKRQGAAHQAGSDSLLTGKAFFRLKDKIFQGEISEELVGKVWGLGFPDAHNAAPQGTPQHYHQQLQENTTPNQNGTSYPPRTPSTPNTSNAGLASTPAHTTNGLSSGPLTPGGQFGGGVFGAFQFSGRQ